MLCKNFSLLSQKTFEIWGGHIDPPPADFNHLQMSPVIGLMKRCIFEAKNNIKIGYLRLICSMIQSRKWCILMPLKKMICFDKKNIAFN